MAKAKTSKVKVLTMTYHDDGEVETLVFSSSRRDAGIINWLVKNVFEARFGPDCDFEEKPTSLDFLLDLNITYTLETQRVR